MKQKDMIDRIVMRWKTNATSLLLDGAALVEKDTPGHVRLLSGDMFSDIWIRPK